MGALPAGEKGRGESEREVRGRLEWVDVEMSLEEKPLPPLRW